MSNPILISAQRKQALSDLRALKIRLQTYSFYHPKTRAVLYFTVFVPTLFIGAVGYSFMKHSVLAVPHPFVMRLKRRHSSSLFRIKPKPSKPIRNDLAASCTR